jgi:hypothetical protein
MRGAIPIAVVGSLIIMVIIIILSGILLMRVFSWTKDTVVYFFEGFFSPPTPLEKALICYYHICANTGVGCRHPNVDKWCRDIEVLSLINYDEICSLPSALKADGEQCRKAYWQFPLRINLGEPQEVRVKTLRNKRNVDSGKEYVFLLRPTGEGGKVYSGSRFASFTIGNSVNLVNFVNEENPPYSCPEGNVCLESATVDKSSYEISGIIYYKGGIYVPVGTKGSFSGYYSFYSSGQSYEVKVDFKGNREMLGYGIDERLLRISVDAEKKQGDELKDYNYILSLKDEIGKLNMSFWGGGKKSTLSDSCSYHIANNNCKDFETVFQTSGGGSIRVKIKDITQDCMGEVGIICFLQDVTFNITYEGRLHLTTPPRPSTPPPPSLGV